MNSASHPTRRRLTSTSRERALPALAEAFREHGFEGTSVTIMSAATGLANGSLYNYFPGGKEEMLGAVLEDIDRWFEANIFTPLRTVESDDRDAADAALLAMVANVSEYFRSGMRVCLPGAVSLSAQRDRFAVPLSGYFERWIDALTHTMRVRGYGDPGLQAQLLVATIQGAIVIAHSFDSPERFQQILTSAISTATKKEHP